ncbi:hypothetical protein NMY22_g7916 [Coprinellus aureogranulatus]|nr:hypothetical protein NMY22_g7916 [Coprinellus aureogranulatus]
MVFELRSPFMEGMTDFTMDVDPSPLNLDMISSSTDTSPDTKDDTHPTDCSTPADPSKHTDFVGKCEVLIERIQWLFELDQYAYDAYGYEYSGLGLYPVIVRPRVDSTAAKQLLRDILKTIDPYITEWVSTAQQTVVGSHLAVLKVFKTAFEAYPSVRCWNTVHDALCRFLQVLLCTKDVNIGTIASEIRKYEIEQERVGPTAIVDAHAVRAAEMDGGDDQFEWASGRLSPIESLESTFNWDDLASFDGYPTPMSPDDIDPELRAML